MNSITRNVTAVAFVVASTILLSSCSTDGSTSPPTQDFPSTTDSQNESGNWDSGTTFEDETCNDSDDIDCDGTSNRFDFDIDGDGIPNSSDNDMDGDGFLNIQDRDDNGDGRIDGNDAFDADGDGTPDYVDLDPGGDGVISPNFNPEGPGDPFDLDGDGIPNAADWDKDGDGIAD
jgi:hypothetical protein